MDINERDWKLFRKYLPDWQENYMEKLIKDYIEFLKGDGLASDKFWSLKRRLRQTRRIQEFFCRMSEDQISICIWRHWWGMRLSQ